jgi:hypothetical protein
MLQRFKTMGMGAKVLTVTAIIALLAGASWAVWYLFIRKDCGCGCGGTCADDAPATQPDGDNPDAATGDRDMVLSIDDDASRQQGEADFTPPLTMPNPESLTALAQETPQEANGQAVNIIFNLRREINRRIPALNSALVNGTPQPPAITREMIARAIELKQNPPQGLTLTRTGKFAVIPQGTNPTGDGQTTALAYILTGTTNIGDAYQLMFQH